MYYKFKVSSYKVDVENKSFIQINDAEDASSISVISNERAFNAVNNAIINNIGEEWLVISEEEFTFTKQKVLNILNN